MKKMIQKFLLTALTFSLLITLSCNEEDSSELIPPMAEKIKKELTIHNHTRIDNYYWLNEKENPKVIEYLEAENEYTKKVLKNTEKLQDVLYNEIIGRIKQNDESVPYKKNGYYYYNRYEEGKEYPIYCRKKESLDAEEEIILNVNELSEGHSFCRVSGLNVSPDNNILAYGVDTVSRRKYSIYFKNLTTGKLLKDVINITTGSCCWANDNKTVFYTTKNEVTLRSQKIHKHVTGTEQKEDKEVFYEEDETFSTYVYKSKSDKYIIIGSYSTLSSEVRFLNADNPNDEFKIFNKREKDFEYGIEHFEDKFYIRTNLNAENFKLMETPVDATGKENWKDVIPARDDVLLEDFEVFKKYLVISERKNGLEGIRIMNIEDNTEHYINFEEETYSARTSVNLDFDTDILRYKYTSLTTPQTTYDYNMITKGKKLLKQQEVLGDFKSENYEAKRIYATAKDGTKIPISLVYRKGFKKDGNSPCLQYSYGSYGYSADAGFRLTILSLLDRGFVYAIAHIRGGQEMGRSWYEDGKLFKKKNTFTDFIDCSKYLTAEKYTSTDRLFAMGGSAGGLLTGAVYNMSPELYKGVISAVPFVDIVTTMLDESIPLTTSEFDEWGDPKEKEYYDYMLSYSPYDNVKEQDYPAMLVTTGLHDSQVQYFEPAKWVAKLRDMKTDDNMLLLHTNMDAGHGGVSGRFQRYKETALQYAFILNLIDIRE